MQTNLRNSDPSSSSTSDFTYTEEFKKFSLSVHSDSDDDDNDDSEFTFACAADDDDAAFCADDTTFDNGKIRPVFPLFDQSLVFSGDLPHIPPVKHVFVEACDAPSPVLSMLERTVEAEGLHVDWYTKGVEVIPAASPDSCKKSSSTGFSKIWRFKEMSNRSHSDGRDAFVFLKPKSSSSAARRKTSSSGGKDASSFLDKIAWQKKSKDSDAAVRGGKTTGNDDTDALSFLDKLAPEKKSKDPAVATRGKISGSDDKDIVASGGEAGAKKKGGGKGKRMASAHEVYVKSRAATKEEERRRSYLPYKPELVGFFTNVHGGMSKNVHPY